MRCRKCDYPLWNLRSRACPECGLPFTPSSYDFIGNSVQYRCTECGQDYYGTDERGHLIPNEFNCVSCGARQHMDEMILLPTEGVTEEQTQTDDMPWLDRPGVKSWFKTGWRASVAPTRLARTIPDHASAWPAWKFAIINGLVLALEMVVPFFLMQTAFISGGPLVAPGGFIAEFAGWVLGIWVGSLAYCLLWGAVVHGVLKLTGGTAGGIGMTYQGILYPSWIHLPALLIPLCGFYAIPVTGIWWPISAAFMIARLQRAGGLRVALAVCIVPILAAAAPFALMIYGFASAASFAATAGSAQPDTQIVAQALNQHNAATGGYPAHAIGLLDGGFASPIDFVTSTSATDTTDIPLGSITLEDAEGLADAELQALVQQQAQALPQNVVAHRIGDFVFTYHGVNPSDPNLWTVIMWPDPDTNTAQTYQEVVVGHTDGRVSVFYTPSFTTVLQGQNQLRASAGLPPIPDPSTITHSAPAVTNP